MARSGRIDRVELVGAPIERLPGLAALRSETAIRVDRVDAASVAGDGRSLVVSVGRHTLAATADADPSNPILLVEPARRSIDGASRWEPGWYDDLRGVPAVSLAEAADAIATLCERAGERRAVPTYTASLPAGCDRSVLFDLALVTDEPGTLTSIRVDADGSEIEAVRADGVVVATPAGSHGYASAVGGPRLDSGCGQLVLVSVAPFGTGHEPWVGRPDTLRISTTTDGPPMSVQCDGIVATTVEAGSTIDVTAGPDLTLVRPPPDGD